MQYSRYANVWRLFRLMMLICSSVHILACCFYAVATEWAKGKTLDECLTLKNSDIASHLNLPPVKLHCSMLAEDAIKAAVRDYKSKQESDE